MTLSRAFGILLLLGAAYLGVLGWADARKGVFTGAAGLWMLAPTLCAASLLSYVLRYLRWRWLLARAGSPIPLVRGFLAYLAGFAFTATPGKVGELLRLRYHCRQGVPATRVVAAFVFERALDLVVVLALASLHFARPDLWIHVVLFVGGFLACIAAAAWHPGVLSWLAAQARRRGAARVANGVQLVADGLAHTRRWLTVPDLLVSLAAGFAAWLLSSWTFLHLLRQVTDVPMPALQVLAMYPLAMLAGAASMLPGGIGTTELALVAMLGAAGIPLAVGTVAAVGIRLTTLWFAIACGIVAAAVLEWQQDPARSPLALPHDRPSPP